MSVNRKFYYIKLEENYFHQNTIKILESQENGYIYSLILLKLYLQACNTEGCLMMTPTIPYDPNNVGYLAKVIGHDVDHVKEAIRWCLKLDLITVFDSGQMWLTDMEKMIGKTSTEAQRIAAYRRRLKKDQIEAPKNSNNDEKGEKNELSTGVYKCTLETETEKEKEKETDRAAVDKVSVDNSISLLSSRDIGNNPATREKIKHILSAGISADEIAAYFDFVERKHPGKKPIYILGVMGGDNTIRDYKEATKPVLPTKTFISGRIIASIFGNGEMKNIQDFSPEENKVFDRYEDQNADLQGQTITKFILSELEKERKKGNDDI